MIRFMVLIFYPLCLAVISYVFGERDREIIVLRQQILILKRQLGRKTITIAPERAAMLLFGCRLAHLSQAILIVQPETLLGWHRKLVRRRWTYANQNPGRPKKSKEISNLIIRLAKENPVWGYGKIQGELKKLGISISQTTIGRILIRNGFPARPYRAGASWRNFLGQYKDFIWSCDFFTVETAFLARFYVLFFLEIGSRRLHIAGCTTNPGKFWVTQQSRNIAWNIQGMTIKPRFLIHDRDDKFVRSFDGVFESEGLEIIKTPYRAPNANAYSERVIRSIREECLDRIIILNEKHLKFVLKQYEKYYNEARPHQGIDQCIPNTPPSGPVTGQIKKRAYLAGLLNDYYREAA